MRRCHGATADLSSSGTHARVVLPLAVMLWELPAVRRTLAVLKHAIRDGVPADEARAAAFGPEPQTPHG